MLHDQRADGQNLKQHVRKTYLGRILDILQTVEELSLLTCTLTRLRHLTHDDATHQRVIVALRRFLPADDDWGEHLVVLYLAPGNPLPLLTAVTVVHDALERLELDIGDILVVVLVEHHGNIPEGAHERGHGGIGSDVEVEDGYLGRYEQAADADGNLRLSR